MSEIEVAKNEDKVLMMWNDQSQLSEIKNIYAPNATESEFKTFVQMGIATGLNPFLRDLWLIKYDKSAPAQIFIGRDGFRKVISRNPNYDYHFVDAVYSNDDFCFDLTKGEVKHTSNFKDRGKLMGAYCLVKMKNSSRPHYVFVELSEYNTNQSVWKTKPATMLKKVAECQAIRMADSTCSGTYDPDEVPEHMTKENKSSQLNKRLGLTQEEPIEGEVVNQETGEITSPPANNEQPPQPVSNIPNYSFEEIKSKMEAAKNIDELTEVASIISDMQLNPENKSELTALYRERLKALKNL